MHEMTGVKIRSRQSEYAADEKGSIYHYNKEWKGTGSNNLKDLRFKNEEGVEEVTDDMTQCQIMWKLDDKFWKKY